MRTHRLIIPSLALAVLTQLVIVDLVVAEDSETKIEEKDFKVAAEYLATNDICADSRLRSLADLTSASCEDDLAFYSKVCWPQLDGLNLNYEATNDDESREKLISVSLLYGSCVRSELLRQIVRKQDSQRRKDKEDLD